MERLEERNLNRYLEIKSVWKIWGREGRREEREEGRNLGR